MKVAFVADHLDLPYRWHEIDVMSGITRSPDFLARNPAGQVPCIVFNDGRVLAQSNAIMMYLAAGSALIPSDAWHHGKMLQWLFWEQYSHETSIAVVRFRRHLLSKPESDIDPLLMQRGNAALDLMEQHLDGRRFLVGDAICLADVALVAYTRWAHEGGFDLESRPAVRSWISRVESDLDIQD